MPNMEPKKCPMPAQDAEARSHNFNEVALGYTAEMAVGEAQRCLQCKNKPCVAGCPVAIDIPAFVGRVAAEDFAGAFASLSAQTSLPAVCGRVCPQETQCEAKCVRGIKHEPVGIGRLERFVADWNMGREAPSVQNCEAVLREPAHGERSAEREREPMTRDGREAPSVQNCEAVLREPAHGERSAEREREPMTRDGREGRSEQPAPPPQNGYKVAVVGAGPAGLTAAGELAKKGYAVTIFEALHKPGGVLVYGIPEFRLPKAIVNREIDNLKAMGVDVETNMVIGKVLTIDELFGDYEFEAVFIGSGAGLPKFMNIPGESLNGVFSANEFLTRINLMGAWQEGASTPVMRAERVAVVGGGNVAMDAARCAKRLGAKEVTIVYRRGMAELPARAEEVEHAEEEGIEFKILTAPVEVLGDEQGRVVGMRCVKFELGEPDQSGRRRPVQVPGSEFVMDIDAMIMSIGTSPNPLIRSTTPGLEAQSWGGLITKDDNGETTREGVWAGGDAVTGAATVILAMGAGKDAAADIDRYIQAKHAK